jgi:hypothetical protein
VRTLLADAQGAHPPAIPFDPDSVADLMLGVVQGTLLVAKTRQNRAVIVNNIRHCRAYVLGLFGKGDAKTDYDTVEERIWEGDQPGRVE